MKEKDLQVIRNKIDELEKLIKTKINEILRLEDPHKFIEIPPDKLSELANKFNSDIVPLYWAASGYRKVPKVNRQLERIRNLGKFIRLGVYVQYRNSNSSYLLPNIDKLKEVREDLRLDVVKDSEKIIEDYKNTYMKIDLDLIKPGKVTEEGKDMIKKAEAEYKNTILPLSEKLGQYVGEVGVAEVLESCNSLKFRIQTLNRMIEI